LAREGSYGQLLCEPVVQNGVQIPEWWRPLRPGTGIRKHSILLGMSEVFSFPGVGAWPGWVRIGRDPL
jgi:hypothetical protein